MNQNTSFYQIQTIEGARGNPIQLAGKNIWTQIEDTLSHSTIFSNSESPLFLIFLGMNNSVVGVAETKNHIYIAYTMDADSINTTHALRF